MTSLLRQNSNTSGEHYTVHVGGEVFFREGEPASGGDGEGWGIMEMNVVKMSIGKTVYRNYPFLRCGNIFRWHLLSENLLLEYCSGPKIFLQQTIRKTSCSSHFAAYYTTAYDENGA